MSKRGPTFYMTLISLTLTGWHGLFTVFKSFSIFQWLCEKLVGGELKVNMWDSWQKRKDKVMFLSPAMDTKFWLCIQS